MTVPTTPTRDVSPWATPAYRFGLLIGAAFGLIDIEANAGVALPSPASTVLRALGVSAFVGLILLAPRTRPAPQNGATGGVSFGRGYWLVVAGEVAAIAIGNAVLSGPLDAPHAVVAWVSVVVGAHFFGLAVVWRMPFVRRLGAAIALCGALGFVAAAAGASAAPIAAIAGLAPGALLLGTAYWGSVATRS